MANIGALSSLGLGSSGVLSYDVIDQLKEADKKAMIDPIDRKYELLEEKRKNLDSLSTLTASLKSSVLDLSSGAFYAKRTVETVGDSVKATVVDGVAPQEFTVSVQQLAKRDIWQSKGFAAKDSAVTTVDTTMTLTIDGKDYTIDVTAGTTLDELKDLITEKSEGKVIASILDTGAASDPFTLILKSAETGAANAISVAYDDGDAATTNDDFLSLSNVQSAVNAKFTYNGVVVERASNSVEDLVTGMTLELLKEDNTTNTVEIVQDVDGIADQMSLFVESYNNWISAMNDAVKYDPDNQTAGIFQDESAIKRLISDVTGALYDATPDGYGVASFGLSVNRDGFISFDKGAFTQALRSDPDQVEKVFSDPDNGIFTKVNDILGDATGTNGALTLLDQRFETQEDRLSEERQRAVELLDARYAIMAQRFMAYDNIIGQLNTSFQALQNLIDAELAAKK